MSKTSDETPIPLSEARKLVPSYRPGKSVDKSTLLRWILTGAGGQKLEARKIGGCWFTTKAAIERFTTRITEARGANLVKKPSDEVGSALHLLEEGKW